MRDDPFYYLRAKADRDYLDSLSRHHEIFTVMRPANCDKNGNFRFDFVANNHGRITKTRKQK